MLAIGVLLFIMGAIAVTVGILQNTVFLSIVDIEAGLGRVFGDIDDLSLDESGNIIAQNDSSGNGFASVLDGPGLIWIIIGAVVIAFGIAAIIISKKKRKSNRIIT